jgi:hypothetical protein
MTTYTLQKLPDELQLIEIPEYRYNVIKKMIETVINGDFEIEDGKVDRNMAMLLIDYFNKLADPNKKYTKEDMSRCFYVSRDTHPLAGFRYDTFDDFLKSLNK